MEEVIWRRGYGGRLWRRLWGEVMDEVIEVVG